jgi:iron complex transport system substrate-binding protein
MVFVDQLDALTVFGRNEHFFQVPGLRNLVFEAGIDQSTATIDAEQLLAMDPDIIFLNYYDLTADPAKLYADPRFADLKAVKNHQVYVTPKLDPGSHESPLVWSWMAALAYPDKVDADLRAEIAAQMKAMYDIDLTDDEIDSVLQYDLNKDGAHYAELFGS